MTDPDHHREQARLRQARKRQRERADRIELQTGAAAATLPVAWQPEFLDLVRRERARAGKALAEVEKAALLLPEGSARKTYLRRNYRNTKVSVSQLRNKFVRCKRKLALSELDLKNDYVDDEIEGYVEDEGRLGYDINWSDLHEVAWIMGDPADADVAALRPCMTFLGVVLIGAIGVSNTLIGFAQAIELFRFLDNLRVRHVAEPAA